jgi:hypothetical protein
MGLTIKCGGKGCRKYFHVECLRRSKYPCKGRGYGVEERGNLGREFLKWFGGRGGGGFPMIDYEWMCLGCGVVGGGEGLRRKEVGRKRGCLKTFKRVRRWIGGYKKKLRGKCESDVAEGLSEHDTHKNHQELIHCEKLLLDSPL